MFTSMLVFIPDAGVRKNLSILLKNKFPHANIHPVNSVGDLLKATKVHVYDIVFIPGKEWAPDLFAAYTSCQNLPLLVMILEGKERYPETIFFSFKYCLQAPFSESQVNGLFNRISREGKMILPDWNFLLLKIDWKYIKLSVGAIKQIEKRGKSLTAIIMEDGKTYLTFMSVTKLFKLLPENKFVRMKKGLIVGFNNVILQSSSVAAAKTVQLHTSKWIRGIMKAYEPNPYAGIQITDEMY